MPFSVFWLGLIGALQIGFVNVFKNFYSKIFKNYTLYLSRYGAHSLVVLVQTNDSDRMLQTFERKRHRNRPNMRLYDGLRRQ